MSYKKAGIIAGIIILSLSIAIYYIGGALMADSPDNKSRTQQTNSNVIQVNKDNGTEKSNNNIDTTQTSGQVSGQLSGVSGEQVSAKPTFSQVDITQLGNPSSFENEIMFISNKRVILHDGDPTSKSYKQISFALDFISSKGLTITHFVTKSVYESFNVGDRLKVQYEVFKNKNGVLFPSVTHVSVVE